MKTPQQPAQPTPRLTLAMGHVFRSTFDLYRNNLSQLLTLELVLIIPTIILLVFSISTAFIGAGSMFLDLFQDIPPNEIWKFTSWMSGLFLLILLISAFVTAWQQASVLLLLRDPKSTYGNILKQALVITPRVGGLALLMMIVLLVGFLLFILPGIYLSVLLSQVVAVAVLENLGVASFRRSRDLVHGHWWWTFGIIFLYSIAIGIVTSILTSIAGVSGDTAESVVSVLVSFFLAPLSVCFYYTLYRALRAARGEPVS